MKHQLLIIVCREVKAKLRNKSLYIIAFITPLLFMLPMLFSMSDSIPNFNGKHYVLIANSDLSYDSIEYRNITFVNTGYKDSGIVLDKNEHDSAFVGVVDMKNISFSNRSEHENFSFYPSSLYASVASEYINDVESFINSEYVYQMGKRYKVDDEQLSRISNFASISVVRRTNDFESSKQTATIIAFGLGLLLYILFIMFNNNIVSSVAEEKQNKLAEVLSMFVDSHNLMFGKIIGLGIASFVQLCLWIVCFVGYSKIIVIIGNIFGFKMQNASLLSLFSACQSFMFSSMMVYLIVFFILGFFVNGALSTIFAVSASSKGPTIPMVMSNILNLMAMYLCMYAAVHPDSVLSKVASYIPFSSYLVIPALIPYGIPLGTVIVSSLLLILVAGILIALAGKMYKKSIG